MVDSSDFERPSSPYSCRWQEDVMVPA